MHEDDEDIMKYKQWLADCFVKEKTFQLKIGESCRINDDHVEKLPEKGVVNGFMMYDGRFKLMYKRLSETEYRWLDSEGNQGIDPGPLEFYAKHWVKV